MQRGFLCHIYTTLAFLALLGAPYIYEISSLRVNFNRVPPHVPSLKTPPPPPHNRVQNKHVLHRCRLLYLRVVQRVLKTHWDSRRLGLDAVGVNTT